MRTGFAVAGALLALGIAVAMGGAQPVGEPDILPFRVVWRAEGSRVLGPTVQGSVYNDWIYPVRHVQLRIQAMEGATVRGETYKFVLGDIAPGSRAYFVARVPAAAGYRVSVVSFERIGGGL